MAAKAVLDLVSRDSRFLASMSRVRRAVAGLEARMAGVASSARRMLLIGGAAIAGFLALAGQQIAAETKLEAVLKATGNAAGLSAEQLKAHAAAIQEISGVGDEAVINMQAILATFKQIRGDEFRRATESIVDMSIVLGTDLQAAAIQVGKALNDPIRGVSMLSRSGITFTDVQLKMIKTLAKAGDIMGAQQIVLEELESQFGGAAEEIGKTFVGSLKKAKSALGDVGEGIGNVFIPFITKLADAVTGSKDGILAWVEANRTMVLAATGATFALAALTIGVHLAAKAFIAATIAVKALHVAMIFLSSHPIILALTLIAAGVTALVLSLRNGRKATADLVEEKNRLRRSSSDLTDQLKEEAEAHGKAPPRGRAGLEGMVEGMEEEVRRRGASRTPSAIVFRQARERLFPQEGSAGLQMGPFREEVPSSPREWRIATGLDAYRQTSEIFKTLTQLSEGIKKAWESTKQAAKSVNDALDSEAKRIKEMILTDKERLAIELKRVDLLRATGRLTTEEARKAKEAFQVQTAGVAAIEDASSMFRRIQAAAGGRRADPSVAPQLQTAQSTTATATATAVTAKQTKKSATMLGDIIDMIRDVMDNGLKVPAVFN